MEGNKQKKKWDNCNSIISKLYLKNKNKNLFKNVFCSFEGKKEEELHEMYFYLVGL